MASIAVRGALKAALVLCVAAAFWNGACTEPTKPKAQILVNPSTVSFTDTVGNSSPGAQSVAVSTDGQGTVTGLTATVNYGSGSGWLAVALSDTVAPATLTLTPNITGLTAATYQATVTISGTGAASPLAVPVTFDVAPLPPVTMVLTPSAVSFNDTTGTSNPGPQMVSITKNGTRPLTGLTATINFASGGAGWLTATLSDTSAPATLTLKAKNAGLNAATYRAMVNISSTTAGTSPESVSVTYDVAAAPPVSGVTVVFTANLGTCGGDLAQQTAKVIEAANPDYIFMMGGSASPSSGTVTTLQDYVNCYDPLFGRWKDKTYATLGDHEVDIDTVAADNFGSGMASGADAYFGAAHAGPPGKNWQSFDIGGWHVVALNVQTPGGYKRPPQIAYHAGSPQLDWLFNDLQSHNNKCTLGVWYESMWISSAHISNPSDPLHKNDYRIQDVRGVWTALYENNADLVVNGWPRIYERFAPMRYAEGYQHPTTTEWAADSARGIRQITSGLGGDGPIHADSAIVRLPTSEYRSGGNGVLKVVLGDGVYSWEFLNTKYSHIQDSGSGVCH